MRTGDESAGPDTGQMAIIVVNYGSSALLAANVGSLDPPAGVRIVVVDNFSSTAEADRVAALCAAHGWELIALPVNAGFGSAVNAGTARAAALGCECFLLLNPDASVSAETVSALREHVLREPCALITPRIETSDGRVVYRGSQVELRTGRIAGLGAGAPPIGAAAVHLEGQVRGAFRGPVQGWLPGACLAVHRTMFERIGGFDEPYFLYWEDVDLSRRVEAAGGTLVVRQDLVAVHDEGGTHGVPGARARSTTYYYYNCRNRLLFAARHLDRRGILRWMRHTPAESWQILLRGGRRQLIHSPRPLLAAVRGSFAGLMIAARALLPRSGRPAAPTARRTVLVVHPGVELYGSDRVMLETVAGLSAAGHDVTVALPGHGALTEHVTDAGAVAVECPMPVLRKSALRPRGAARLVADVVRGTMPAIRLIRRAGRDGVYISTVTVPWWIVLARVLGRHVVCHVHEAENSAGRVVRTGLTVPLRLAHTLVVNSHFSLEVLLEVQPSLARCARVLANPVPAGPPPVALAAQPPVPVRLLYVGRLSPRKGPDVAIAAVAELRARGVPAELSVVGAVFAGYEWFEDRLHEQVGAAGIGEHVHFLGFRDPVRPLLDGADVVLVPSRFDEPFGNTAVEAVLAARPLVVSRSSGLREAAAGYDSVQFVPPGSPEAVADAVQEVLANWQCFRALALGDREKAARRHSSATYRSAIVRLVS